MPPVVSSLSAASRMLRDFVKAGVRTTDGTPITVMVGSPARAAPRPNDTDHRLNLFFYQVEAAAVGPWAAPDEVHRVRLYCLMTAFGADEEPLEAGENDLRILGEVVRLFHETPLLEPLDVDGETVRLQVVPQSFGLDQINHLWSTQGEAEYRPSVAYEVSLVPVVPLERRVDDLRAGALGVGVHPGVDGAPGGPAPEVRPPKPILRRVETGRADWAPAILFVVVGEAAESLSFPAEAMPASLDVWVGGAAGAAVELRWQGWFTDTGWRDLGEPTVTTATGPLLDPASAGGAATTVVALPASPEEGPAATQLLLYALRPGTTRRSNPLLVSRDLVEGDGG